MLISEVCRKCSLTKKVVEYFIEPRRKHVKRNCRQEKIWGYFFAGETEADLGACG